jgi:ribose/xylose/arabinose/galactoside ABC-type transport system permease subunit
VAPSPTKEKGAGGRFVRGHLLQHARAIVLILFVIVLGALNKSFLTPSNFGVILLQVCTNAFLAVGATFVILTGGIDLSVGSIVGLTGVVAALLGQQDGLWPAVIAVGAGVLTGAIFGALNGLFVAAAKVPPFVTTLGTMTIALGVAYVLSNGSPISGLSDEILGIGQNSVLGIPIPILAMLVVLLVSYVILTKTRFGLQVYAVGGNIQAARIAGVNVRNVQFLVYVISGLLAGVAGVILASRVTAGIPTTGVGYELNAIAAAVIGGISLMGGRGSLSGTIIGFLIIGVLDNGLNIMNVSPFYQEIIKGAIIIGAVWVDSFLNRKGD